MIVLLAGVFLLVSAGKISDYYEKSQLEPELELQESLKNMNKIDNFRYRLQSAFIIEDREEVISKVEGEKEGKNSHIKGEMVNTAVDIYYIDRIIYNYDSFSQKWLVVDAGMSNGGELLISELEPMSNFKFNNIKGIEKIKFEKINGTECLLLKCNPSLENKLLDKMWKDFAAHLWIDYKKNEIKKAVLTAINKNNDKSQLKIEVIFKDCNKKIKIVAPDTSLKK